MVSNDNTTQVDQEERIRFFFEPCQSKEELRQFVKVFLKVDLPDETVDEESNSNPLQFVWDVYSAMMSKQGKKRHVSACARNTGKCLAEGTMVATPSGPVPIELIKVNDTVYDEFGKPIRVVSVWDQGVKDCVALKHGREIIAVCTEDHKWLTLNKRTKKEKQRRVRDFYRGVAIKRRELSLPLGNEKEPLAYVLGALSGDGCSRECGVRISSANSLVPDKVAAILGTKAHHSGCANYTYIIEAPKQGVKWVFSDFYEKHIRGRYAHEKTVDWSAIKTWDRNSLLDFVAGVVDTDGSVFEHRNQMHISVSMQAVDVVEAIKYAFLALWQIDVPISKETREYKNGPMWTIKLNNLLYCKRILRELDDRLVSQQKKWKPEYENMEANNTIPDGFGVRVIPVGKRHCYDLTVDSETSLYCLQNGAVTHNTLTACIIRLLGMIHFRRSGTHLAANLEQSASANMYLEKFLMVPEILPYIKTNNTRTKEFTNLPPNSFTTLSYCNVRIATATIKGVNSQRGSLNTRDEVDLVPQEILSEAAYIADPTPEGLPPVEINLSSRKSNSGPIQRLINEAESGDESIQLHKWSTVDWMWKCPEEMWKPQLGMIRASMNIETLKMIWGEEAIQTLSDTEKQIQRTMDVPVGCRSCPAFLACQGRARFRKSTRGRLRDAQFVGNVLKEVAEASKIIAQSLNWKPESSAIVFRIFNRRRHYLKPAQFFRWATGQWFTPATKTIEEVEAVMAGDDDMAKLLVTPTKRQIYEALRKNGWKIHYGVDWGTTDPAVTIVVGYHRPTRRLIVLHTDGQTGYPPEDWAKYTHQTTWQLFPCDLVCPDMADTNSPVYFGRLGMPCHDKKPAKIAPGVGQILSFMWNPFTQTEHFAMLDDGEMGMNRWTAECFEKWTYKKTLIGYDFNHFEDNEYTHPLDGLRYAADPWIADQKMNFASIQPRLAVQVEVAARMGDKAAQAEMMKKEELKQQLAEHFGIEHGLQGVFNAEERLKEKGASPDQLRGWSPFDADKDDFVTKEKDPLAAEELPTAPKRRIKFKF